VRYVERTASTNADAQALFGDPRAPGTTIVADYQTAGSGRKGRRWFAPPGAALLFTTILPAAIPADRLWAVPFWIALCVADAVEGVCGLVLDLVWPNDLHLHGGKTGGILSVARINGDEAWVGCGVGLNVLRPPADADLDALDPPAVFLGTHAPHADRALLLSAVLTAFDRRLEELNDPNLTARRWEQRADLAGTVYRYRNDADGVERDGVAQRLGSHGALVVRTGGTEQNIDLADVRVVRYQRSNKPASTSPPPNP
jgi:BirA family biotin operon repressor/biotin-[acetyl-CoA-carboxylase] ligase